jgi:citrate lyase subunit beta / citryl-CoA lyase
MRLRRSELSTPGSNERMIQKAADSAADLVFLDLEDSVSPSEKDQARRNVIAGLTELDWGSKTRAVRINGVDSPWALDDITEIVLGCGERLELIIIPKAKSVRDVWWVDTVLDQLEQRIRRTKPIALEVLIEEAQGLAEVDQIARATPRLEALIFGPGDFSASLGIRVESIPDYPGDLWAYPQTRVLVAAKAAGIEAVDGPYWNPIADMHSYQVECQRASIMGFSGKWAIHPSQIEVANAAFGPTAEAAKNARAVIAAYDEALARGVGAITVNGELVDVANVRLAREVVARALAIEEA